MYVCVFVHVYIDKCGFVCMCVHTEWDFPVHDPHQIENTRVCMYLSMYVCMYAYLCMRIWMEWDLYDHAYIQIHVHTHVYPHAARTCT
jgi:hypothetical protein